MVRPTISRKSGDVLDPNPALSVTGSARIENKVPVIQVREMESVLQIPSGETVVLGLDANDAARNSDTQPGLTDTPFNYLVGHKDRAKLRKPNSSSSCAPPSLPIPVCLATNCRSTSAIFRKRNPPAMSLLLKALKNADRGSALTLEPMAARASDAHTRRPLPPKQQRG